ncbi:MAG: hypothetical protein OEZ39_02795 [Gammaproteobacteria bacterium]|nr:hypothetical protein [Gammaproteobacteria bacterium]
MKTLKYSIIILFSIFVNNAYAATLDCTGTITSISIHQPDKLAVALSSTNTLVYCTFSSGTQFNSVTPEACREIANVLAQAKNAGNSALARFETTAGTCGAITGWTQVDLQMAISQ